MSKKKEKIEMNLHKDSSLLYGRNIPFYGNIG